MAKESDYEPQATDQWLVCTACGTQYPSTSMSACRICNDPRQFTPPSGQAFIPMAALRRKHQNIFLPSVGGDHHLIGITTQPKFAIGQRAILVRTPAGNILWDCLSLIDAATINHIRSLGGLQAIVISHPHYFSSHVEWAAAFQCPVYLRSEDRSWTVQQSPRQVFLSGDANEIRLSRDPGTREPPDEKDEKDGKDEKHDPNLQPSGAIAIRLGGHFPGSQVLLYEGNLLIADTLVTTPSGLGSWTTDAAGHPATRPPNMNSFAFMWSIPNMIPLSGDEVFRMWGILKNYAFTSTHGAFTGTDIVDENVKQRVLESMKIHTKYCGWDQSRWEKI